MEPHTFQSLEKTNAAREIMQIVQNLHPSTHVVVFSAPTLDLLQSYTHDTPQPRWPKYTLLMCLSVTKHAYFSSIQIDTSFKQVKEKVPRQTIHGSWFCIW